MRHWKSATAGGCSRKLDAVQLATVRASAQSQAVDVGGVRGGHDWGDAYEVHLHDALDVLITTIDVLYAFGDDPERFGRILAVHALSDLFATLGDPLCATLALGVTHDDVDTGRASAIARGVARALVEEGTVLAGGHTVVSTDTFAGLSVVGHPRAVPASGNVCTGDVILLSKPLGSGLAITAERYGVAGQVDLEGMYAIMSESNRTAADRLVSLQHGEQEQDGLIRRITDVSGFGFLDALKQLVGDARVRIAAGDVPVGPGVPRFVDAQAWSALLDANLLESSGFTAYGRGVDGGLMQAVLNDPQTSGGLLAVAAPEALRVHDFVSSGVFTVVGVVEEVGGRLDIQIAT